MFLETYVASWILAGLGITHQRPNWLLCSAVLATPLCLYFAGGFHSPLPLLAPLCFLLSSISLRRHYQWLAVRLVLPPIGFFLYILWGWISQASGSWIGLSRST